MRRGGSSAAPRPLAGITVVITGSRRATEQSALVSNMGGTPLVVPTIGIGLPSDDGEIEPFLRRLVEGPDYAVFTTATGVRVMMDAAERLGVKEAVLEALNSPRVTVVARSGKPRGELARSGAKVDLSPPADESTAAGVLKLHEARGLSRKSVAILRHGSRDGAARGRLIEAGARDVQECLAYRYSRRLEADGAGVLGSMGFRYVAPDEAAVLRLVRGLVEKTCRIDAITFTSPPAVGNLFVGAGERGLEKDLAQALNRDEVVVVAVGPTTRNELEEEHGVRVRVMPRVSAMGAMMNALAVYLANGGDGPGLEGG